MVGVKDQIKFGGNIVDTSKQKPDLMGKPGASADGVKRILAHLEHGAKLPASKPARTAGWSIDGWTLGLTMLLLGMCCIAWLMHEGDNRPGGFKQSYGSSASRHEARRAATAFERTPTALARADLAGQTPEVTHEQPAAIINDPAAHVEARLGATTRPAREASLINAFGLPSSTADAAAHARSSATGNTADGVPAGAGRVNANASTNANANAGAASAGADAVNFGATNPGAANTATRHTAIASRPSARLRTPSANDTDVTLLTALVAHAGKPSVSTHERSRDIVERYDGDNTADLLARCKQLGVIEGMLCRSRICSGRWDSDPMCRAPAQ